MTSMQFVIQPIPGTDEQFFDRLREVSDKVNKFGVGTHRIFEQLKIPVKEVVIGPNHIGVLLEDGKVFRVAFSINSERLDLSKSDAAKHNSVSSNANASKNSGASSTRQLARSRARLMRSTGRSSSGGQGSGSRSSGVIIGGSPSSRPLVTVPATYVPEELVSQAEVVLQGKSRNLIIRELQRTNLDVNLAVNNLLSRDDEEAEETEEGSENYVPEDLISLLDNGFHTDNNSVIIDPADGLFSEEIFSNYSSIRNLLFDRIRSERNQSNLSNADNSQSRASSTANNVLANSSSLSAQISSVGADREAFSRWRDRQYYGPRRWLNKEEYNWEKDGDSKKKESNMTSPIWISEELQPWPDANNTIRFKKIVSLYSELIGLSENGELHQWKWSDSEPYKSEVENVYHPRTLSLNITDRVEQISANFIRCSVVTESNRVATWMDEHLGYLGAKLEHPAIAFNEFLSDPIISISVCSLYTAVRTESNIYWWGVLPFDQRRYLWEKFRTKAKKPFKTAASEINIGTQVVMKKCPIYQAGSIGFTCTNGVPKVGQLLNSIWDFNDVCRFKILNVTASTVDKTQPASSSNASTIEKEPLKASVISIGIQPVNNSNKPNSVNTSKESTDRIDMPPPPSPASSTCSDTGSVTSHKRPKRLTSKDECEGKKDEELWQLRDVVFIEDKIGPIGKVLKVDGDFVAVRFPPSSGTAMGSCEGKEDDWQQCRLLRREDVQVYKVAVTSRGPDCLQKVPKKINISQSGDLGTFQLLALAVDIRGIHIIKKVGSKLYYSLYNLYNSKLEQNCQFPTDSFSFLGFSANNISMHCNNDCSGNSSTIVLLDGNRTVYPLAKDCIGSIKDPHWLDLPPVKTVSMTTISLPSIGNNMKSKVCMTAILFETQKLMPHILRCDVKNAITTINRLEKSHSELMSVIEERCDGCRNIFHTSAVMCAPTTNKDSDDKKGPSLSRPGSTPAFANSSVSVSLENSNNMSTTPNSSFTTVQSNTHSGSREGRAVSLREMMNRLIHTDMEVPPSANNGSNAEEPLYIQPWSMETNQNGINDVAMSGTEEDISKIIVNNVNTSSTTTNKPQYTLDPIQRRENAMLILQHMCSSSVLRPYLIQMLSARDAQGQTPFMLAISHRAYEAGLILLNTILAIADKDNSLKDSMIFPTGSPSDQSPLHVICYNDTCSFTWTGADHINQNIYECKTCGLTGSLCCCTECARVCHKGHDCKLKRTSPTAYCDCWEKCKCKALIAGNQNKRFTLLCHLASYTDLVTKFNAKGESILLFLIQTVGRQAIEQRQYRANSRVRNVNSSGTASSSRKSTNNEVESDMPDHDLEPPKFAKKALERLLVDWNAVRAMIMTGAEKSEGSPQSTGNFGDGSKDETYNIYLQTQDGTTLLDKFTHNLFVKCSSDHLDTLLMTLVREMQNEAVENRITDANNVARRFIRSVVRVFVIFNLEKLPNPERRKSNLAPSKHIQSCVKVFQTLYKISVQELCEVSEALIAPVRLGVVRPTAPFAMSLSNIDNSDDLFSVDPLAPSSATESVVEPVTIHEAVHDQATTFNLQSNYNMDNMDSLRDTSENDETANRDIAHGQDDDMLDTARNEDGMQDDESDNDFTFNDAETESDSDDNQSNQDAQRSVQTGATVGSETDIGVLFLEDESGDSSPQDEEGSEDGETDDHSDEFNFADNQLERRSNNTNTRNDLAPQSMQWAIRNRESSRSSVRVPAGSSLVFIDPMALRRSTVPTSSTVTTAPQEHHTMATTSSNLARAFGIVIRQISELINTLSYNINNDVEMFLKLSAEELVELQTFVESRLKATWDWMFSVMDSTEAQLKFGAYLTNHTDPTHPLHPLNFSSQSNMSQSNPPSGGVNLLGSSSRREFFSYCLSLMRAHSSEHRDALPVLDITALRHIAYVLDAFIYYMRNESYYFDKGEFSNGIINMAENEDTDEELSNIASEENAFEANSSINTMQTAQSSRKNSFFTRSDSTLSLGCLAPEGFDLPLDVAMPLADKPHLLQPSSKREDLFANIPLLSSSDANQRNNLGDTETVFDTPPTRLSFSKYESESGADYLDNIPMSSTASASSILNLKRTKEAEVVYTADETARETGPKTEDRKLIENEEMETDENPQNEKPNALPMTRPEVIIAPNKIQQSQDQSSSSSSGISLTTSTESPLCSVIVRAGTSDKEMQDETVEPSPATESYKPAPTKSFSFPSRGFYFCNKISSDSPSWNFLLGRWKLTLDLFGRVFMDDVGMETGSILPELRGFPVKEMRFRRHMEKLRNGQQRDLILCKLERNRDSLIIQTFKELNTQFGSQNRRIYPPLTFNRVKVTFKDEPGEGSGVARSFYTSISEALLAGAKIPNLESVQIGNNNKYGVPFSSILRSRGASSRESPNPQRRGTGSKILWRTAARERKILNYDAKPYVPPAEVTADNSNDHLSVHLQQHAERLYPKIYGINPANAAKITGMLLEIPTPQLLSILSSEEALRQKVVEALDIITFKQKSEANNATVQTKKMIPVVLLEQCQVEDNEPLFYSPGKRGFYTPRQGYGSYERINAFRNVGRLIGLCLLQNELLPLFLQRHVLKYILGRKIRFHDLAFFDPAIYESFRQLIQNAQSEDGEEIINCMELHFVIDLMREEGGGSVELISGGRETQVTSGNLLEYIRRYTEYRLIKSQEKALEALKDGVFDVLPDNCMNTLTSEDLRLLLNGVGDINVSTLISYTTFNDESSEGSEKLLKFKRWFWSIIEKMNILERQDLVYFWTGSPALPASEEGFQPLPSVTIRPADDSHLPTANTCISRLYIPLYSSKTILRSKLLLAIKSKNFGFV